MPDSEEKLRQEVEQLRQRVAELEAVNESVHKAEEKLPGFEARWRTIVENSPSHIMVLDLDYNIRFINRTVPDLTIDEVIGKFSCDFVPPEYHDVAVDCFERVRKTCRADSYQTKYLTKEGETKYFDVLIAPIIESGEVSALISSSSDVTQHKQSEEELGGEESLYKKIISESPIGIAVYDETGQCVAANYSIGELIGATQEQVLAQNYHSIDSWKKSGLLDLILEAIKGGVATRGIMEFVSTFGKHVDIDCCAVSFQKEGATHLMLMIVDIGERKKAKKNLEESENKFRAIAENAVDFIFIKDRDRKYIFVNQAMEQLLGLKKDEILGKTPEEIFGPEQGLVVREVDDRTFLGETVNETRSLLLGNKEYFFNTVQSPLRLEDGKVMSIMGIVRDITKQKQAEEEKLSLERQVQQAQKMESLGLLAGGVAHDFNNLLMGVIGNADLALMSLALESPGRDNIQSIVTAAERAADLAKQMLAYSGKGRFVIKHMDLQFLIEEMLYLLETSISKKTVIKYDFAQNVPPVESDATQVRQIIMNLVINASEAIGDRSGVISIRTGAMECDQAYLDKTSTDIKLPSGTYSYFEITDTGSGIEKETIGKIFDPFFSTKFTGRGLGLSAVLGIVRGHYGTIKVYSEPGKGTTFKVLFPAKEGQLSSDKKKKLDTATDARLKGKTVLLVDDEETVRAVGRQMLERLGLKAVTAEEGREALAIFEEAPDKFDYIILDLTMPHLNGEETFREMRRIKEEVIVVLSSGYNEQDLISRFSGKGFAGFIQKPYRTANLKEKLLSVTIESE